MTAVCQPPPVPANLALPPTTGTARDSFAVARLEPFPGLRYARNHVPSYDDVTCPPYDVIDEGQHQALEARSPLNVVGLELPRALSGQNPYQQAAVLLDAWRDGGVLVRDREPCLYGYRMAFTDDAGMPRQTLGVIGALGLGDGNQDILPHEETTARAKTDRLSLLRATRANLSPIWVLTPAVGWSEALSVPRHPVETATDEAGALHQMWPISDPAVIEPIVSAVATSPVIVADGHHRYETAVAYRDEQSHRGSDAELVMALVVELSDEQLSVGAIHRLLRGLPPDLDLCDALAPDFSFEAAGPLDETIEARMRDAGALALVTPHGVWLGRPRVDAAGRGLLTHDLDAARFEVAQRLLGPHDVAYQHGWRQVAAAVSSGSADAGVLLRPATVSQIAQISRGGRRLPPKTTFFWPKPRTGLVIRELIG